MRKILILMLISWLMTGCWLIPNEPINPLWPSRDDKDRKGKYLLAMIKHPTFTNTLFYNNKGQLTHEEKDGKLTYIYEYDEMGRIWRRTETTPREGENGPYLHYHQLLYNDLGQVVGEEENGKKEYWPGRNHSAVYCYAYDAQGRISTASPGGYRDGCDDQEGQRFSYESEKLLTSEKWEYGLDIQQTIGVTTTRYVYDGRRSLNETSDYFRFSANNLNGSPSIASVRPLGNLTRMEWSFEPYPCEYDCEEVPEPYSGEYSFTFTYNNRDYPKSRTDEETGETAIFSYTFVKSE